MVDHCLYITPTTQPVKLMNTWHITYGSNKWGTIQNANKAIKLQIRKLLKNLNHGSRLWMNRVIDLWPFRMCIWRRVTAPWANATLAVWLPMPTSMLWVIMRRPQHKRDHLLFWHPKYVFTNEWIYAINSITSGSIELSQAHGRMHRWLLPMVEEFAPIWPKDVSGSRLAFMASKIC